MAADYNTSKTMKHTPPPKGGTSTGDGRAELSKCNNQERQWLAAKHSRAQVLFMQAQGLGMNEEATEEQIQELLDTIESVKDAAAMDWTTLVEAMRTAARLEAVTQATKKWDTTTTILAEAAAMAESKRRGTATGTVPRCKVVTEQSEESLQTRIQQQLQVQVAALKKEFETRENRIRADYEDRMEEERERYRQEEKDRTVRFNDELKKVSQEARRREDTYKEEVKKLQEQLQELNQNTARGSDGRDSEGYWWDAHPFGATGTAKDRLHKEPSPLRGNKRLANLLNKATRTVQNPVGGEDTEEPTNNGGEGRSTQRDRPNEANRLPVGSGVLARFGAFQGQVPMPILDPFRTTLQDEGPDYYRQQFPPPFDEPPPADAQRITEFRKLEGLVPKFSGREDEFHSWVALFIPIIHRAKCPVAWKATILNKGMDTNNSTLRHIVANSGATKEDYAGTIHKLVRAFAHPQGIVASKLRALESITLVEDGEHDKAEEWLLKLEAYLTAARARGMQADIFSVQLYEDNLARMDDSLAHSYLMWASLKDLPNNAVTICAWLEERVNHVKQLRRRRPTMESRANMVSRTRARSSPPGKRSPRGAPQREFYRARDTSRSGAETGPGDEKRRRRFTCPIDGEAHTLERCNKFKAMTPDERRQKLREWKRCYACFAAGHNIKECNKNIRCANCTHYHHTLLHGSRSSRRGVRRATDSRIMLTVEDEATDEEDSWSETSEPEEETTTHAYKANGSVKGKVVLQTVPIEVYNGKFKMKLNCLIDQGATGAFMSRKAAEELQVTGYPTKTKITGFDGMTMEGEAMVANIQITAWGNNKKHWVQVQVTKDPAGSYTPHDWTKTQTQYQHIKNLPILPPVPGKDVDIMLGMDTPHLIKSLIPDVGGKGAEPLARFTKLGWIVGGPTNETAEKECRANFAFKASSWNKYEQKAPSRWSTYSFKVAKVDAREIPYTGKSQDEDLRQLVTRMWEIDTAMRETRTTIQDEKMFTYLRENLERTEDGKYTLPTLWKPGHPNIGNNYRYALTRLNSILNRKQMKDDRVQQEYGHQIREWEEKGYTERVRTTTPEADRAYYLPHFAVVRWDKATTKVRIVMDGAAKPSRSGTQACLNDCLQKGPKLVNDLPTVLLRYRARRVAIAADIKKMFFQIKMATKDRDYHRFLWKDNEGEKIYRWAVHPFGSAASPCVAIFSVKDHARRWKDKYPRAAQTVIHSTLVDDNLDSCDTEEEAIELGKQLVALFAKAGMELGKIISSHAEVRKAFPQHMIAESLDIAEFCTKDLDTPVLKTLGMVYLPDEDNFSYEANIPTEVKWTKRTILQHKAKLFDPLGLLSPHIIVAGLLIQRLWRQNKNWDDIAGPEEAKLWQQWLKASKELPTVRIPRCLGRHPNQEAQIHFFCDASADAYAAVAYYATKEEANIIGSKTRVAPIKATSIPRLELLAAELILELHRWTKSALDVPPSSYWYWSDSTNVLSWLRTESRSLQEFVGNRVAKILEETDPNKWNWVPTDQNPADIPSRGATADKLRQNLLWWHGPEFIRTGVKPEQPRGLQMPEEAAKELKKSLAFKTTSAEQEMDVYKKQADPWQHVKINKWSRAVAAMAWARRWRTGERGPLKSREVNRAEGLMIKSMQESALARSMSRIKKGTPLEKGSPLMKLDPHIDQQGLLRVGGRVDQAKFVPYEQRHQKIVPKDHPWTGALIRQIHTDLFHQGPAHVTVALRQKYWLVRANQKVRSVVAACRWCIRQRARTQPQKMGPVVEDRYPETKCRPFTYVALDAAGPYYITEGEKKKQEKAYFILFTCCTVRAVHLEAIFDMSTNSFLMAMNRFVARRGTPRQVRSDNGTNFTAAYSELKKLWSRERVDTYEQKRPEIQWIFNPPKAPYFGGLHERLVGSAKRALYHVAKANSAPTREVFITLVTMVEGVLNSRPLTCVSPDVDAPEVLTPAQFLGVDNYQPLADPRGAWDKKTLWRALQQRMDRLWRRFCMEMRSSLQETHKWQKRRRALQEGDVVVALENKERGVWPLGKVVRTEKSRDNLVRKVQVLINGHVVRRAVNGLILLEPRSEPTEAGQGEAEDTHQGNDNEGSIIEGSPRKDI